MKTMTVLGIGLKWAVLVFAYGAMATTVSRWYSTLLIPQTLALAATAIGFILIAIGVPFYAWSGRTIIKGFPTGELLTGGAYRVCQHPVYGSWIVFIIPGVELLCRSWFGLTTAVFGYVLLRLMAHEEERFLQDKFGARYLVYRQRTPFVLPIGIFRRE